MPGSETAFGSRAAVLRMSATMRFWVSVPGVEKPIELSVEELAARQKAGQLPAGTLAARVGEDSWSPVESLPEVRAALAADDARRSVAPPSSAAPGVELFEAPPSLGMAPTLLGVEQPQAPPPPAPPPAAPPPPRRSVPALAARAWVAAVVAGALLIGAGSLLCVWYRYGYPRHAVLEHVPADCATLEYVDLSAIDDSAAVRTVAGRRDRALTDWSEDLDDADGIRRLPDDDEARGRAAALHALRKLGIRAYGDVKELAFCEVRDEGDAAPSSLLVVGGAFRGKDVLAAIRDGIAHRDRKHPEESLKLEDVDGRQWLRIDADRWATTATSQLVLIGPRKLVERHLAGRPVAREYAVRDDEPLVQRWRADAVKGGSATEERYALARGKVTFTRVAPAGAVTDAARLETERLKALAERLRKVDGMDGLADGYANADVHQDGADLRTAITWTASDLGPVLAAMIDADARHLKPMVDALRGAPGVDFLRSALAPGVDAFGVELSPW